MYRVEKRIAREKVLEFLEVNELKQQQADERNEVREPTDEELCLKDFIFPETLGFPIHKGYRLWISTIPVPNFPKEFARRCEKISLELPTDVRPSTAKSLSLIN